MIVFAKFAYCTCIPIQVVHLHGDGDHWCRNFTCMGHYIGKEKKWINNQDDALIKSQNKLTLWCTGVPEKIWDHHTHQAIASTVKKE